VAPGTLRTPGHLACHPFGKVPYVEHGDFTLYETAAIVRYVDRMLPQPALTPSNPQAAARMDQLMNINDWYLFQGVSNVIEFGQNECAPQHACNHVGARYSHGEGRMIHGSSTSTTAGSSRPWPWIF
jgi:glutathione S-transferase